jgi:hypothetical protein
MDMVKEGCVVAVTAMISALILLGSITTYIFIYNCREQNKQERVEIRIAQEHIQAGYIQKYDSTVNRLIWVKADKDK